MVSSLTALPAPERREIIESERERVQVQQASLLCVLAKKKNPSESTRTSCLIVRFLPRTLSSSSPSESPFAGFCSLSLSVSRFVSSSDLALASAETTRFILCRNT
ncbi:hypothetical protein GmHk_02G004142 [Glycine max]|nr:hypothetical protein GmHk_02G004142 [Glycine max]